MWRWTMQMRCCRCVVWVRALWCTLYRRQRARLRSELLLLRLRMLLLGLQRASPLHTLSGGGSSSVADGAAHRPLSSFPNPGAH